MNISNNKKLLILPAVIIISLILSSFLFFTQINKLKGQIDNLYFGTFIPVHKLHTMVSLYNKLIVEDNLDKKKENSILKNWKYYYTGYKTKEEKIILNKLNTNVVKSFVKYDKKLLIHIVTNLNNIIMYETNTAYVHRKDFLYRYSKMSEYLKYSLMLILVCSLILVSVVIFFSLQKHTELEKLTNQYKIDSITDGLSNIYNRKHFDSIFSKITTIAFENNWKCAFIMIDIDFFKPFNDTYGHDMGDTVIKNMANTLSKSFNKQYEYVFRIGGEEFGVVIFDTNEAMLIKSIGNFQNNIKDLAIPHESSSTGLLTVSMGIVIVDETAINADIKEIYKQADDKLYHSKENGRNQYTI